MPDGATKIVSEKLVVGKARAASKSPRSRGLAGYVCLCVCGRTSPTDLLLWRGWRSYGAPLASLKGHGIRDSPEFCYMLTKSPSRNLEFLNRSFVQKNVHN